MRIGWFTFVHALTLSACAASPAAPIAAKPYQPPDERIILFASGNADVTTRESYFALGYVTAMLSEYPQYHVLIVGYADSRGAPSFNRDLSFRRARAVRGILVDHGVEKGRILIGAPRDEKGSSESQIRRRADVYIYDPLQDEISNRLGYPLELRRE